MRAAELLITGGEPGTQMLRKSLSLLTDIWLTVFLGATAGFAAPPPDKGGSKGGGGGTKCQVLGFLLAMSQKEVLII